MDLDDEELEATRKLNGADPIIEAGEFIRTKNGVILKVLEYDKVMDLHLCTNNKYKEYIGLEGIIVNHSHNIGDLIQPGDYINGDRILKLTKLKDGNIVICICEDNSHMICRVIKNKNIKTILTKEQFKQNCYEVED